MSVAVPLSQISLEEIEKIKTILTYTPNMNYYQLKRKNRYKKYKKQNELDDDIEINDKVISLYKIENNCIYIPFKIYEKIFQVKANLYKSVYDIYKKTKFTFNKTLYDVQISVYNELIYNLNLYGTANLNLRTAFGKTVTSVCASATCGYLTIVFLTNTILIEQWENTYKEFTNANVVIIEPNTINKINWNNVDVIICMSGRIEYIPPIILEKIGTVIIDEAHLFCSPSRLPALLSTQPKYIIAATATPERDDGMHIIIESICGIHKIEKKSDKPYDIIKYNTGCDLPIPRKYNDADWSKLIENICKNTERNNLIIDIILRNPQSKILVLTRLSNHVTFLYDCLINKGCKVDFMTGNKKKYQDSNVLIGTIQKLGTGFDERTACDNFQGIPINLLIIAVSIKSKSLLQQIAGRAFRSTFPTIIALYDDNSISDSHWQANKKWFTSSGGNIIEINSPKYNTKNNNISYNDISDAQVAAYLKNTK